MTNEDINKIKELLKFLVKQKISERVSKLSSDEKKVYELTGEKGQVEMGRLTGFSAGKISRAWQKLENEGLLVKEGSRYRKVV